MGVMKRIAVLRMFSPSIPGWNRSNERAIMRSVLPRVPDEEPDDEQLRLFEPRTDEPTYTRKRD